MKERKQKVPWVPPYERVAAALRQTIAEHSEADGESLGTEVSLAERSGVSRMTARKAVNALIAEGLLERRPGIGLFIRRAGASGIVYRALFGNLFWDPSIKAASAIRRSAERVGAKVEYFDAGGDEDRFLREIAALPASGTQGAIIFSQHGERFDAAIGKLAEDGFPFVVLDESVTLPGVPDFVSDNRAGGELAAAELLSAGHREMAFVGDFAADTVRARWEGFAATCRAADCTPHHYDIRSTSRLGDWAADVRAIAERLLQGPDRPTALFCSCDAVARIVLRCMEDCGLKAPRDLSLLGFDDDPIAEWMSPALTTIRQDFSKMGELAFASLVSRVGHPSAAPVSGVVPVSLVRRSSVAAPPAGLGRAPIV